MEELRLLEAGGDQLEAEAEEEMGSQLTEDQRRRGEELTRKIQQCSAVQCSAVQPGAPPHQRRLLYRPGPQHCCHRPQDFM